MFKWLRKLLVILITLLAISILAIEFVPPRWLANQLEQPLSDHLDAVVSMESVDIHVLGMSPSLTVSNASIKNRQDANSSARAQLGTFAASLDLPRLLLGKLDIEDILVSDGLIYIGVDSTGQGNWSYLLPQDPQQKTAPDTVPEPTQWPAIDKLTIRDLQVEYIDLLRAIKSEIKINATASTTAELPTSANVTGTVNGLPTQVKLTTNPLSQILQTGQNLDINSVARVGDTEASVKGSIGKGVTLDGLNLSFSTSAQDLSDVETITGLNMPLIPPLSLVGDLLIEGSDVVLRRFDGTLGDSDLQGDIRVNPSTSPPTVYANLISRKLDLDDLSGLLGGTPDPSETVSDNQPVDADDDPSGSQRLLPDTPIALTELATVFNGAVEYRAESVNSPAWPVQSMNIRADIQGSDVTLDPVTIEIASGEVSGSLLMNVASEPVESEIELRLQRLSIDSLLGAMEIDSKNSGTLGGQLKYWVQGDSIARMAASADGGMFLLLTKGQLDALLVELAGIDLVESLTILLAPENEQTDINCAYLDLQSEDGVNKIATLVLDTDDSIILGDGFIDMNNESVELVVEPHPKDVSVLAAQTAAHITGTLSNPSVQAGETLYARAAAAAFLAALATPTTAIIPSIEVGTCKESAYCSGIITVLGDARE